MHTTREENTNIHIGYICATFLQYAMQAGCIDNDQLAAQTACRPATAPLPHYLLAPGRPFSTAPGKAPLSHFVAL